MAWKQNAKSAAAKPTAPKPKFETKDDDWDTDLSYQNSVTEKSQRYGSESVPGSGRQDHVDLSTLQERMKTVDQVVKESFKEKNPTRGYGGKYGTEQVMDKAAEGFSYKADVQKHSSQTDGKKGFGGDHGIDERANDKSAVGFDYKPVVEKHSSQTDYTAGFGGKQAVQKEEPSRPSVATAPPTPPAKPATTPKVAEKPAVPKVAEKPTVPKVAEKPAAPNVAEKPAVPKVAEKPVVPKVAEKPVVPKVAEKPTVPKVAEKPATPEVAVKPEATASNKADVGNIRARFENMKKDSEAEAAKRVAEERKKRAATEQKVQQKEQLDNNPQEQTEPHEIAPSTKETTREPAPGRPTASPPPKLLTQHIYENVGHINVETEASTENLSENDDNNNVESEILTTNEENEKEPEKFVGGINVTSILRRRKTSSSSSKKDDDDDDWNVNKDETKQESSERKSPSPPSDD